jgi:murein tripeptide amidase MpaA
VASYLRDWFRVPTTFDGSELAIAHTPLRDSILRVFRALWERHLALLDADGSPRARVSDLGSTVEGRDMNLVTVGTAGADRKSPWVISASIPARRWRNGSSKACSRTPRSRRSRGAPHPRTRGRAYRAEHESRRARQPPHQRRGRQPEPGVDGTRARTQSRGFSRACRNAGDGVDAFLDIHGDEGLPYVFTDGNERLSFTLRMAALERGFADALVAANRISDVVRLPRRRTRRST